MPSSDGEDEFDEGLRDLVPRVYIKADCVMAAVKVKTRFLVTRTSMT